MTTQRQLVAEAKRLARLLQERDLKIVFAESCTGGLISATMTRLPGISKWHCGSAVVYQIETKAAWLGIPRHILDKPGPVSRPVAREMAESVLRKTPQADLAAAVTGHLGPNAPKRQDGLVYAAVARRDPTSRRKPPSVVIKKHRLDTGTGKTARNSGASLRLERQIAAACYVLALTRELLEGPTGSR